MRWVLPILSSLMGSAYAAPSLEAPVPQVTTYEQLPGTQSEPDKFDVRLVFRGNGELWQDTAITSVYRNGALGGGLGIVVTLWGPISVDLEASWRQVKPPSSGDAAAGTVEDSSLKLHLVPVAFMGEYAFGVPNSPVSVFGSTGPVFTVFHEKFPAGSVELADHPTIPAEEWAQRTSQTGVKFGWELRAGTRIDTGFVQPRAFPASNGALDAFEIEVYVARRFHRRPSLGLDLSAWRASLGIALVF